MKKITYLALSLIMIFQVAIPVIANSGDPTVSAVITGNNANQGNLVITVNDGGESFNLTLHRPGNGTFDRDIHGNGFIYSVRVVVSANRVSSAVILNIVDTGVPAPSTVSARITGNNANQGAVEITVVSGGVPYTLIVQRPGNNSTVIREIEAADALYIVRVVIQGNGISSAEITNAIPISVESYEPNEPNEPVPSTIYRITMTMPHGLPPFIAANQSSLGGFEVNPGDTLDWDAVFARFQGFVRDFAPLAQSVTPENLIGWTTHPGASSRPEAYRELFENNPTPDVVLTSGMFRYGVGSNAGTASLNLFPIFNFVCDAGCINVCDCTVYRIAISMPSGGLVNQPGSPPAFGPGTGSYLTSFYVNLGETIDWNIVFGAFASVAGQSRFPFAQYVTPENIIGWTVAPGGTGRPAAYRELFENNPTFDNTLTHGMFTNLSSGTGTLSLFPIFNFVCDNGCINVCDCDCYCGGCDDCALLTEHGTGDVQE